jgi:hypothetical protein
MLLTEHITDEDRRDHLVEGIAEQVVEIWEQFIHHTTFSLAGAMKLDEILRAMMSIFQRHATVPLRRKFGKLREMMLILTSDADSLSSMYQQQQQQQQQSHQAHSQAMSNDLLSQQNFIHLTPAEVEAVLLLRTRHY